MTVNDQAGAPKRGPGRPRKDATSHDVATVEAMPRPVTAEQVMGARRAEEYPALAAQNADEPNTDNTGRPEANKGNVLIEAITRGDLHLGDERVLHGDGHGEHGATDPATGMAYAKPNRAKVPADLADTLVKAGLAKHV